MQKTKESDAPDGEWPRIERAARSHLAAHGKRHVVPASADIHAALITELSRYAPPGMPGTDEFNAREDAIRGLCQQNGENDELMDQISCMLQESDPKFVAVRGNPYHHCERGIPPPLPRSQPSGHGATKSSGGGKQNIGGGVPRCPGASALRLLKTARSTFRYVARSCYGAHKQYLPLHFFWPKARVRFFEILFPLAGDKRDVFVDALKAGPNIYRCIPARRLVETFLSPSISFAYFFWDYNRLEKQRTDILLIDNMPWLVYYNVYSAHTQKGFQKISGSFSPPWSPPPIADFFGAEVASLVAKSSHRDDNCAFMALMLQVIEGLDLVHQDVPGEYPQPKEFQSCAPGTQVCLWEKKPSERFVDEIYLGKTVEEEWTCIGAHTRVLVPNADGAISTRAAKDLRVGDRVIVGGGTAGGEGGWRRVSTQRKVKKDNLGGKESARGKTRKVTKANNKKVQKAKEAKKAAIAEERDARAAAKAAKASAGTSASAAKAKASKYGDVQTIDKRAERVAARKAAGEAAPYESGGGGLFGGD